MEKVGSEEGAGDGPDLQHSRIPETEEAHN